MEGDLRTFMLADTALAALVARRVEWVQSSQSAAPRVVMYVISDVPDMMMQGASGLSATRVQIDCIGLDYPSARDTARAVKACLVGHQGTTGGTRFEGCFLIGERDDYSDADTPNKLFRKSLDFNIWHKEI